MATRTKRQLGPTIEGVASEEQSALIDRLEDEMEAHYAEERVNMRWPGESLAVVKQAAERAGVPYQTYVRMVAYRQALTDLRDAEATPRASN